MTSKISTIVKAYNIKYYPNKNFDEKQPEYNMHNKIMLLDKGIKTIATVNSISDTLNSIQKKFPLVILADYNDPNWFEHCNNSTLLIDTQNTVFDNRSVDGLASYYDIKFDLYENGKLYQNFQPFKNKSYFYNYLQAFYNKDYADDKGLYNYETPKYMFITDNKNLFDEIASYESFINLYEKAFNYKEFHGYNNIIIDNNIKTIVDILAELSNDQIKKYIDMIKHVTYDFDIYNTDSNKLLNIFNDVLNDYYKSHDLNTYRLLEPSEQIKAYLDFTKLYLDKKYTKLITDDEIEDIKQSEEYKIVLSKLKDNDLQISKTQQFNVLQSLGIINSSEDYINYTKKDDKSKFIYNLSDMGSGKTLMTVETIYLADLQKAKSQYTRIKDSNFDSHNFKSINYWFPAKTLVAPALSIESSWVKIFNMFYDSVEKVSSTRYKLGAKYKDITFYSYLDINAFTVKNNGISSQSYNNSNIKSMIETSDTLIIDEIHQLLKGLPIRNSKKMFDQKPSTYKYKFVLSGTLSDLTPTEWYKYIKMMDLDIDRLCDPINRNVKSTKSLLYNTERSIARCARDIKSSQNRTFKGEYIKLPNNELSDNKSNNFTIDYQTLQAYFGDKILYLDNPTNKADKSVAIETVLLNGDYKLNTNTDISNTPNIKLFYRIVGRNAITATTHQISKELTNKTYPHETVVIKSKTDLDEHSIKLLKTIHNIASDYNIYKSKALSTKLNNAMLNLNDGLSENDLYNILNSKANTNNKFLEYLTKLNLSILEDLKSSQLIEKPSLEDSEKLRIVRDILDKESNEKFLIIVNDLKAAKALSKALAIPSLTNTDLNDPLKYQEILDNKFEKQNIVVVPQFMIKSSLNLQYVTRLIQYQLNEDIADIIQTQNRIDRIGKTHDTKAYYIATDVLQENIIELFLETYKNVKIAHRGIVELFEDVTKEVNVINDYIDYALENMTKKEG